MPVTFGAANTVTGAGTWTYPDVGLVIGLLIQVDTADAAIDTWGSVIPRYTGAGVYAPITEAGHMRGWPIGNAELVTYDIGHGPVGVAYDLSPGTEITITEILSESPPTGGGGGSAVQGAVVYDWDTSLNIPNATWTTLANSGLKAHTNDSVITASPDGGATAQVDGVYQATLFASWGSTVTPYQADVQLLVGGTPFGSVESSYMTIEGNLIVTFTYVHNATAGTSFVFQLYQNSGSTQPWNAVLSYALLAPS